MIPKPQKKKSDKINLQGDEWCIKSISELKHIFDRCSCRTLPLEKLSNEELYKFFIEYTGVRKITKGNSDSNHEMNTLFLAVGLKVLEAATYMDTVPYMAIKYFGYPGTGSKECGFPYLSQFNPDPKRNNLDHCLDLSIYIKSLKKHRYFDWNESVKSPQEMLNGCLQKPLYELLITGIMRRLYDLKSKNMERILTCFTEDNMLLKKERTEVLKALSYICHTKIRIYSINKGNLRERDYTPDKCPLAGYMIPPMNIFESKREMYLLYPKREVLDIEPRFYSSIKGMTEKMLESSLRLIVRYQYNEIERVEDLTVGEHMDKVKQEHLAKRRGAMVVVENPETGSSMEGGVHKEEAKIHKIEGASEVPNVGHLGDDRLSIVKDRPTLPSDNAAGNNNNMECPKIRKCSFRSIRSLLSVQDAKGEGEAVQHKVQCMFCQTNKALNSYIQMISPAHHAANCSHSSQFFDYYIDKSIEQELKLEEPTFLISLRNPKQLHIVQNLCF